MLIRVKVSESKVCQPGFQHQRGKPVYDIGLCTINIMAPLININILLSSRHWIPFFVIKVFCHLCLFSKQRQQRQASSQFKTKFH